MANTIFQYEKIYLCEKASQVSDICNVYGWTKPKDWQPAYNKDKTICVVPLQGHLLHLLSKPEEYDESYKVWSEETIFYFPDKFKVKSQPRTQQILNRAIEHLKNSEEIIIATDLDNEGAALALRVIEKAGVKDRVSKMVDMSMPDPKSLKKNLESARVIDWSNMAHAGYARAQFDWVEGMALTRAQTIYIGRGNLLVYGGVKVPTIYMIVDRYLKNKNFTNIPFWNINGSGDIQSRTFEFSSFEENIENDKKVKNKRYDTEDAAIVIQKEIEAKKEHKIDEIKIENTKKVSPQLYNLSGIQSHMSKKFNIDPDITLDILQSLYQKYKVLSYPRSGIKHLSEEMYDSYNDILESAKRVIGSDNLNNIKANGIPKTKRIFDTSKVKPHHGIIPTLRSVDEVWDRLTEPERKVYTEIALRTAEAVMPAAEGIATTLISKVRDGLFLEFKEEIQTSIGWEGLRGKELKNTTSAFENCSEGDLIDNVSVKLHKGETKPEPIFTKDTLITAMENISRVYGHLKGVKEYLKDHGIGTDATRANILTSLLEPKNGEPYIKMDGKKIIPTMKGIEYIKKIPQDITSPVKRAKMTEYLKKVEFGEITIEQFLEYYKKDLQKSILKLKEMGGDPSNWIQNKTISKPLGPCPACKDGQIIENKKTFSCSNARNKKTEENGKVKWINEGCQYSIFKSAIQKFGGKDITAAQIKKMLANEFVEVTFKSKNTGGNYKKKIIPDLKWGIAIQWED
jgi:DNA topoisomerase-3